MQETTAKPAPKLLTKNNPKIAKGAALGYYSVGVHLAPANLSGHNTCPMASAGCRLACLNTSGHGRYNRVQESRITKTKRFFEEREAFMAQLVKELRGAVKKAARLNQKLAVRLNLTSDIQWENVIHEGKTIFEHFPGVQFYDYTAIAKRMFPGSKAANVPNYHLTFSRKEDNQAVAETVAAAGGNVAVVFSSARYPQEFMGRPVVSGDETDLRFLDKKGAVVALYSKGRARRDESGFVVATE